MAERTRREMNPAEIDEFLESRHTGVLSMADGDDAYGIPVSFEYVADEQALFFRFGYGPGSRKGRFVEAVDTASFAVYDEVAGGWKSVVVEGDLQPVSESSLDPSIVDAIDALDIPYFEVRHGPVGNMDFSLVRLDATTISGVTKGT